MGNCIEFRVFDGKSEPRKATANAHIPAINKNGGALSNQGARMQKPRPLEIVEEFQMSTIMTG